MKVYELMNELSDLPAGATVRASITRREDEMDILDIEEDKKVFVTSFEISHIEFDDNVNLTD